MSMSKKDFQALAAGLHRARPELSDLMAHAQWLYDVQVIARVCQEANPHFDRERFLEACETGTTKGMKKKG